MNFSPRMIFCLLGTITVILVTLLLLSGGVGLKSSLPIPLPRRSAQPNFFTENSVNFEDATESIVEIYPTLEKKANSITSKSASISRASGPISSNLNSAIEKIITMPNSLPVNPGCISRKIINYEPIDIGDVYHHPPVVQYVKLSRGTSPVSLSFMDYVAMMSAYKFLQTEHLY